MIGRPDVHRLVLSAALVTGCHVAQPAEMVHIEAGASAAGVLNMAGNVAEWVADWMDAEYYRVDPMPPDPQGPSTGDQRVYRGGAFDDPAGQADNALHLSSRASAPPSMRLPTLGFRCARSSAS